MKSVKGGISGLNKSADLLSAKLVEMGLTVELEDFRCGAGGAGVYGPSYVDLTAHDDKDNFYINVKIHAGGYGDIVKWGEIKKQVIEAANANKSLTIK